MGEPIGIGIEGVKELVTIVRQHLESELEGYEPPIRFLVLMALAQDYAPPHLAAAIAARALIREVLDGEPCTCSDCVGAADLVRQRSPAWQRAAEALKAAL